MAKERVHMKGEEFFKQIIDGERDFAGVRLESEEGTVYDEECSEAKERLKTQDLKESPIILDRALIQRFNVSKLYMPFLQAREATFEESDIWQSELKGADFEGATFYGTSFFQSNLEDSNFRGSFCDDLIIQWIFGFNMPFC